MPSLVCPFPLSHLFFLLQFHLSLASAQVSSSFWEGTWNVVPCPPPLPWNLVQSLPTTAVTTGNCRPCICDKLKNVFFFLKMFFVPPIAMNAAVVPKFEAWSNWGFRCTCHRDCARATDYLSFLFFSRLFFFLYSWLWDVQQAHTHIHTRQLIRRILLAQFYKML